MVISSQDIDIADYIDHALLNPHLTMKELEYGCQCAIQYNFQGICVYPSMVKRIKELVYHHKIKVVTVIGFPTGVHTSSVKLYESQEATENGADELDVVINVGWLKEGKSELVYQEIASIVGETNKTVKAILETNVLTPSEKKLASQICLDAGVTFLKTSTGWFGGATVEDVKFLYDITGGKVQIKASGGIRNLEDAVTLINAGATRLGTSRGVEIVKQQQGRSDDSH